MNLPKSQKQSLHGWLAKAIVCLFLTVCMLYLTCFCGECRNLQENVLRVHILANSDTKEDQALKLQVRDALLMQTQQLFASCANVWDAVSAACTHLQSLQQTAQQTVLAAGYTYPVQVSVEDCFFPTKEYGQFALPAGVYRALRVVIGEGGGQNWWCMLFPTVCVGASVQPEVSLPEAEGTLTVRWKLQELFEKTRQFFARF